MSSRSGAVYCRTGQPGALVGGQRRRQAPQPAGHRRDAGDDGVVEAAARIARRVRLGRRRRVLRGTALASAITAVSGRGRAIPAQSLGADRLTTFRRITLPAILPGIVAAALFGFIASFGNLEMSLFLVGPGRTTLPIAILQYLEWKIDPTIAAVSVLQILFIGGAMLLTDRFVKIGRVV